MEFNIYFKLKSKYEKRKVIVDKLADFKFFKALLLTIEKEIEKIRQDIMAFENSENKINIRFPTHSDDEIQKKLNILIKMRKNNLIISEFIKKLLQGNDFIICFNCGKRMYKTPIGVPYEKVGNNYIIKEYYSDIKYSYCCENCVYSISENIYNQLKILNENSKLTERLVYDRFGCHFEKI